MEQLLVLIQPLVEAYLGDKGFFVQLVSIVGTLRLIIKPVMSLIEVYVAATPSKEDDLLPSKIMGSKLYKQISFVLDYLLSIKLPKK
jgi:hypothetical protein